MLYYKWVCCGYETVWGKNEHSIYQLIQVYWANTHSYKYLRWKQLCGLAESQISMLMYSSCYKYITFFWNRYLSLLPSVAHNIEPCAGDPTGRWDCGNGAWREWARGAWWGEYYSSRSSASGCGGSGGGGSVMSNTFSWQQGIFNKSRDDCN